jgi:molecular chaperone GrpE
MTAKHEPRATPEVEQDSGVDQAPEAAADELIAGEPGAPSDPMDSIPEPITPEPESHTPEPEPGTPEPESVEQDLHELTVRAEKADEYLELAKRTKADFENYRKRAARESAAAQERGVVRLAKELLPAVDNLDRALAAAQAAAGNGGNADADATLISGVKLVHQDVIAALSRVGIEPYSPEGEQFDPQHHEAVAQLPVEGAEPGTIIEVYQRGYRLGESVLRPARVVVAG